MGKGKSYPVRAVRLPAPGNMNIGLNDCKMYIFRIYYS